MILSSWTDYRADGPPQLRARVAPERRASSIVEFVGHEIGCSQSTYDGRWQLGSKNSTAPLVSYVNAEEIPPGHVPPVWLTAA